MGPSTHHCREARFCHFGGSKNHVQIMSKIDSRLLTERKQSYCLLFFLFFLPNHNQSIFSSACYSFYLINQSIFSSLIYLRITPLRRAIIIKNRLPLQHTSRPRTLPPLLPSLISFSQLSLALTRASPDAPCDVQARARPLARGTPDGRGTLELVFLRP